MDKAPEQDGPDRLLLPREAAAMFRVDPKTVARWHALGLLKARRTLGGQRRYWESQIRALAAEQDTEAVAS